MFKTARNMAGLPWIAAMAFFMQALDATILNTALPDIARSLNHSPLAMQSAVISYTLTVALLIPVSGWLADRFGTRRVFIIAVILFSLGSLLCAFSPNLPFLVVSRIIQGIGGAMMMPVARLALLRAYPRSELLPILNFVTIPGLVGPVLGPLLGGILVTYATGTGFLSLIYLSGFWGLFTPSAICLISPCRNAALIHSVLPCLVPGWSLFLSVWICSGIMLWQRQRRSW